IHPEGWSNWDKESNEKTAVFSEYKNTGKGAAEGRRAKWAHQLNDEQAKAYTYENVFHGWVPDLKR
ncbi:MAG: pectinesterase family protein, partial [Pedobacter sp.]|nr:pectinesterase family protein [Pedobacter sp.]